MIDSNDAPLSGVTPADVVLDEAASGNSGTDAAEVSEPSTPAIDAEAVARLIAHLDELKVPRAVGDRELPVDERLKLLVLHFRTQYHRLDRGVEQLANAIDMAYVLLTGQVVSYRKIERAAAILKQAGQAIKPRGA